MLSKEECHYAIFKGTLSPFFHPVTSSQGVLEVLCRVFFIVNKGVMVLLSQMGMPHIPITPLIFLIAAGDTRMVLVEHLLGLAAILILQLILMFPLYQSPTRRQIF